MARPASHYIICRSSQGDERAVAESLLENGKFAVEGEPKAFGTRAAAELYATSRGLRSYSIVPVARKLSREEFWKHIARERRSNKP